MNILARVISYELSTTIARRVLPWEIRPLKRWLATSCARWRRKATPEVKGSLRCLPPPQDAPPNGINVPPKRQEPSWRLSTPLRRGFFVAGLCNDVFFGLAVTAARSGQSRVITINLKLGSSLISYSCPSLHFTSSTS